MSSLDTFEDSLFSLFQHRPIAFSTPTPSTPYTYRPPAPTATATATAAPHHHHHHHHPPLHVHLPSAPPHLHSTLQLTHIWLSSIYAADLVVRRQIDVRRRTVCELGAGAGLAGVVACTMGATGVVGTDYDVGPSVSMSRSRSVSRSRSRLVDAADQDDMDDVDPTDVLAVLRNNYRSNLPQATHPQGGRWNVVGHTWGEDVDTVLRCLDGFGRVEKTMTMVVDSMESVEATSATAAASKQTNEHCIGLGLGPRSRSAAATNGVSSRAATRHDHVSSSRSSSLTVPTDPSVPSHSTQTNESTHQSIEIPSMATRHGPSRGSTGGTSSDRDVINNTSRPSARAPTSVDLVDLADSPDFAKLHDHNADSSSSADVTIRPPAPSPPSPVPVPAPAPAGAVVGPRDSQPSSMARFDTLLLCDLLWSTTSHAGLVASVRGLMASGSPRSRCFTCSRSGGDKDGEGEADESDESQGAIGGVAHVFAGLHHGKGAVGRFVRAWLDGGGGHDGGDDGDAEGQGKQAEAKDKKQRGERRWVRWRREARLSLDAMDECDAAGCSPSDGDRDDDVSRPGRWRWEERELDGRTGSHVPAADGGDEEWEDRGVVVWFEIGYEVRE